MKNKKSSSTIFDQGIPEIGVFGRIVSVMPGMGMLRLVLAFAVVMGHTGGLGGYSIANGGVAVQIFYMISGFFIFMILSDKYGSALSFYKSRAFRIYPTYLFLLFLIIIAYASLHAMSSFGTDIFNKIVGDYNASSLLDVAYFCIVNIGLLFLDSLTYLAIAPDSGHLYFTTNFSHESLPAISWIFVAPAWTLSLEILFYLLAPVLIKLKTRWLIALIAASILLRFVANRIYELPFIPWNYMFFPFEISQFLLGAVAYRFYKRLKGTKLFDQLAPFVVIIFMISLFAFNHLPHISGYDESVVYYLIPASFALPCLFHVSKNNRVDRWFGELSYPVYLSHTLIIFLIYSLNESMAAHMRDRTFLAIPVMTGAFLLSVLINHYIQAPIDRMRHRRFK